MDIDGHLWIEYQTRQEGLAGRWYGFAEISLVRNHLLFAFLNGARLLNGSSVVMMPFQLVRGAPPRAGTPGVGGYGQPGDLRDWEPNSYVMHFRDGLTWFTGEEWQVLTDAFLEEERMTQRLMRAWLKTDRSHHDDEDVKVAEYMAPRYKNACAQLMIVMSMVNLMTAENVTGATRIVFGTDHL